MEEAEGVVGEQKQKEEEEFEEENEVLQINYLRIPPKKYILFCIYSLFYAFLFLGNSFLPEQLRKIQTYFCLGEQNSM